MRMTLHAMVVSHRQAGLIVTIKMASAGRNVTVTIRPLQNQHHHCALAATATKVASAISRLFTDRPAAQSAICLSLQGRI
jgi:hypothetical protein